MKTQKCTDKDVKTFYERNAYIYCKRYRCILTKSACLSRRVVKVSTSLSQFRMDMYQGCIGCEHNIYD